MPINITIKLRKRHEQRISTQVPTNTLPSPKGFPQKSGSIRFGFAA
jgi:hypothetical protein